jgi:acetyl esterase/lipase
MSQDITRRRVVYEMPNEDSVIVQNDLEFPGADGQPVTCDLYRPGGAAAAPTPAVIMVAGFPDAGMQKLLGCRFKEMQFTVSWGKLIAASGLAAVAATNREPAGDLAALIGHLSRNADALGIAEAPIGVLASSGHGALALSTLMTSGPAHVACGAFLYPYTLDLDEATGVTEMSKRFGFVNGCAGRTTADLRSDVPMFFARAGQDAFPHLNASLDRLLSQALSRNLPLTVVNYPAGVHGFDLMDPSDRSRDIIRSVLTFLTSHLRSANNQHAL